MAKKKKLTIMQRRMKEGAKYCKTKGAIAKHGSYKACMKSFLKGKTK